MFADLEAEEKTLEETAPKPVKVKKPKPEIRIKRRRANPKFVIREKKLIREEGDYFVIQFPEEKQADYEQALKDIQAFQPQHGYRLPYDPDNNIPADQLTYLSIWKMRVSEEALQAIAKFGKSNRFAFESDIAVRAQMSSIEGRKLEKMSYAESCSTLELPKFKFGINPQTRKNFAFLPFQKAGIAYALKTKRTFIADEMGLGKTVEAIGVAACDLENIGREGLKEPWLFIVPSNLRINWYKEIRKWLPKKIPVTMIKNKFMRMRKVRNRKTGVIREIPTKATVHFLEENQVFVMTYDKIHRFGELLIKKQWRGISFDESHYLKGRSTKRAVACRRFTKETNPEFILLLSGTPLMNKPYDLIPQLQILDRLNDFGGHNHFMMRYCALSTTNTEHVSKVHKVAKEGVVEEASDLNDNTETIDLTKMNRTAKQDLDQEMKDAKVRALYENMTALNKALRSVCFVRREKADVLKDLPAKQRQTIAVEITNRKDYESIEADVMTWRADLAVKDKKFLLSIKKFSKEKQAAAKAERRSSSFETTARAQALVLIQQLKVCAAIGKMKPVCQWINDFLESGKKLVVFATHNVILNELEAMYPEAISIRSKMSPERRDEAVTKFQTDKKCKMIIVGLKLAVGMTLTAASDTLTIEFGWTPAVHDQAEDRVHRIGQKESVTAYYIVAARTIDEKIGKLIEEKRRVVNSVADGDPLKGSEMGSVMGELLAELTGRMHL